MLCVQVLAFGGGVKATLQGGEVSGSHATYLVAVLANSILTINATQFNNNTAIRGMAYGSVLSRLNILNAAFSNNQVTEQGGAVFVRNSSVTITSSNFTNNTAGRNGGALYATGSSQIDLYKSWFITNSSPSGGAVVVQEQTTLTVGGCVFERNMARPVSKANVDAVAAASDSFYNLGIGGAILTTDSELHMHNNTMFSNVAVIDGGKCVCLLVCIAANVKLPLHAQL